MAEKKPIDWEAIETDYRAGIKSLRVMATEYGVSHVAIKKRADREEWVKDLSAKIKAAAEAKVNKAAVNREVNAARKITDKEVIEVAAETQKDLILGHRQDIGRARRLAIKLLEELEGVTDNPELIQQLAEMVQTKLEEEVGEKVANKMMDAFHKAASLPGRVGTMKMLSETLKNLTALEREAFGIESKTPLDGLTDAVRNIGISFVSAPNRAIA